MTNDNMSTIAKIGALLDGRLGAVSANALADVHPDVIAMLTGHWLDCAYAAQDAARATDDTATKARHLTNAARFYSVLAATAGNPGASRRHSRNAVAVTDTIEMMLMRLQLRAVARLGR